ncbi:MAG TPA: hypothetical protein VI299_09390 [Polyangiales bacterium]
MAFRFVGFVGVACLALACSDEVGLRAAEDPVMVGDCPCRLEASFENLAVCASPTTPHAPAHAYSSSWDGANKKPLCEAWSDPQPVPAQAWSKTTTVRSACTGAGQLCVALKAGDAKALSAEDCELARHCADVSYPTAGQPLDLGAVPAWVGSDACSARFEQLGGYLELNVASTQLGCGTNAIERIQLCPPRCSENPMAAGCEICSDGSLQTTF